MSRYDTRDNTFLAWYPACVNGDEAAHVWEPASSAFYVHIPFCTAICDYCGFAVERVRDAVIPRYLDALRREIERYGEQGRLARHRFDCGHFGGGTPSVLSGEQLGDIVRVIRDAAVVSPDAELTIEVNPISFTADKAHAYREAAINRLSCGVQSFDERTLKVMGRPHRARDVQRTIQLVHETGFENFSLDIMYGIPGQTLEQLERDLLLALETGAPHLSCFRLETIPFTALRMRQAAGMLPPQLSVEAINEMTLLVGDVLTAHGMNEYGAFNYARPGFESVHNAIAFGAPQREYVGFGNSSFSYFGGHVYTNHASLKTYEEAVFAGRDPIALAHRVDPREEMSRYFVLGLKMIRVARAPFRERFGFDAEEIFGDVLGALIEDGYLARDDDDYVLTRAGRLYVNNVCKEFYVGDSVGKGQHPEFVPTLTADQVLYFARQRDKRVAAAGRTPS